MRIVSNSKFYRKIQNRMEIKNIKKEEREKKERKRDEQKKWLSKGERATGN